MKHQVEARDTWRVVKVESEVSRGVFGYLTGRRGTGRDFGCDWEAPKTKVTALQVSKDASRGRQWRVYIHTHTFPLPRSGSLPIHQTVSKNEKTIQKKKMKKWNYKREWNGRCMYSSHQLSTLILVKEFRLGHCYPKIQNITTNTNISYFAFHFHHLCKSACQHFIFIFLYYSTLESCLFIKMRIYISTFKGYERFLKKIG